MRLLQFLILGVFFGFILSKAEIVSWYRIQEMFRFQDFHMYGVIGSAVVLGVIIVALMKRTNMKNVDGLEITFKPKDKRLFRAIAGGTIFGIGWALTGACPGPMYILIGNGVTVFVVVLAAAILGALTYGAIHKRLPH
ncbi:MAG: DUF6691 family protein [Bacteroidota bacterium]